MCIHPQSNFLLFIFDGSFLFALRKTKRKTLHKSANRIECGMYVYKERALWAVASIDKTQTKHLVEENLQTLFFLLFSLFLIFSDFRTEDFFYFFFSWVLFALSEKKNLPKYRDSNRLRYHLHQQQFLVCRWNLDAKHQFALDFDSSIANIRTLGMNTRLLAVSLSRLLLPEEFLGIFQADADAMRFSQSNVCFFCVFLRRTKAEQFSRMRIGKLVFYVTMLLLLCRYVRAYERQHFCSANRFGCELAQFCRRNRDVDFENGEIYSSAGVVCGEYCVSCIRRKVCWIAERQFHSFVYVCVLTGSFYFQLLYMIFAFILISNELTFFFVERLAAVD